MLVTNRDGTLWSVLSRINQSRTSCAQERQAQTTPSTEFVRFRSRGR